jgi:hypothetical protein
VNEGLVSLGVESRIQKIRQEELFIHKRRLERYRIASDDPKVIMIRQPWVDGASVWMGFNLARIAGELAPVTGQIITALSPTI